MVHDERIELFRKGRRRGQYEAVRGRGKDRTRTSLGTSDEAAADSLIQSMNDRLITGGQTSVQAILDLYRHSRGDKWDNHNARSHDRILTFFGAYDISDVKPKLCRAYIRQRNNDGMAANTIRLELNHLRTAAKHAYREDVIDRRPNMEFPTSSATRERWLERDEFDQLMGCAIEAHAKLYLLLAVVTAARPSHILALTWDQIDLDRMLINFRKEGERQTSKRKPHIPITETLCDMLIAAKALSRTTYVVEYRGRRVNDIKTAIRSAARRADLDGVSPYVLRHTAGTWMAMAGVPLLEIAERMGHSTIDTTRKHYLHFMPEFLSASTKALDVRPKLRNDRK
jgi:integrase